MRYYLTFAFLALFSFHAFAKNPATPGSRRAESTGVSAIDKAIAESMKIGQEVLGSQPQETTAAPADLESSATTTTATTTATASTTTAATTTATSTTTPSTYAATMSAKRTLVLADQTTWNAATVNDRADACIKYCENAGPDLLACLDNCVACAASGIHPATPESQQEDLMAILLQFSKVPTVE